MKIKKIAGLFLLALCSICLVACSDDDGPSSQAEINAEAVGSWAGWTHLTTTYINKDYTGDTFVLTQDKDGSLTAVYQDTTWGTATINGINAVKAEDGTYALNGGEGSFVMNNVFTGETQEFACQLASGTISADKKTLTAVISAYMSVGHGNMTFSFYTGEKAAEIK